MFKAPRGTQDILPAEQPYWQLARDKIREVSSLYGFRRIDPPLFEETGLFVRGVGETTDIVEKEMYTFKDKGGESLTLLPEGTASFMRAYLEHGMQVLPQPVKLYSTLPLFRYERPQAGRFRQHYQFNAEAIGEAHPAVDAEIIALAWSLYSSLGLKGLKLQLNSIGDSRCRPGYNKLLTTYLREHQKRLAKTDRERLSRNPLRVLDSKESASQKVIAQAPKSVEHLCEDCAAHFAGLREYLGLMGISYTLNHRLVRGLDYYTRTVFEFWAAGIGAQNAVGGGGRYDGLAKLLGGKDTPGVGFGLGLERIILAMQQQKISPPPDPGPQVYLLYHGAAAQNEAIRLAEKLRGAGIRAGVSMGGRSLKAQMKQADREGVKFALILGEKEIEKSTVTAHIMQTGEEFTVAQGQLLNWLSDRLFRR
ncbi:MAG: histidine--tRNA ligase [Chloroflexi bacterium]|nr:histidine--tRNA ligase [Chloroflexota bacterium]